MSEHKEEPRFTFAYWNVRGLGAPARLMFAYKNVTYKRENYETENGQNWFQVKYKLNLSFPNLPFLFDNSKRLRITESRAIYRYLGRALGIGNHTDPLQAYDEMVGDIASELHSEFYRLCADPNFEERKVTFLKEKLPKLLEPFENWLSGSTKFNKNNISRKWLGGEILCYADFVLWEALDRLVLLDKNSLDHFPTLSKYYSNFKEIETIKHYLENDETARYPIFYKTYFL